VLEDDDGGEGRFIDTTKKCIHRQKQHVALYCDSGKPVRQVKKKRKGMLGCSSGYGMMIRKPDVLRRTQRINAYDKNMEMVEGEGIWGLVRFRRAAKRKEFNIITVKSRK